MRYTVLLLAIALGACGHRPPPVFPQPDVFPQHVDEPPQQIVEPRPARRYIPCDADCRDFQFNTSMYRLERSIDANRSAISVLSDTLLIHRRRW